jgi:hypothetical protein
VSISASEHGRLGRVAAVLAVAVGVGCGTLGGDPPTESGLPNRGIVPWTLVEVLRGAWLSSWVFAPPAEPTTPGVREPCVRVERISGRDAVVVYAAVQQDGAGFIGRATSADGIGFGAFESVLDDPDAQAPHVAVDTAGRAHLVFASGGAVFHTVAGADGRFESMPEPWAEPADGEEFGSPALVFDAQDTPWLYFTRVGTGDDDGARIEVQAGPRGVRTVVLAGGTDCRDAKGDESPCWDGETSRPDVRRAVTATGRTVYRMLYAGGRGQNSAIGFAAAFAPDGPFDRYAFNPVLEADDRDYTAPSSVPFGAGYLLYVGLEGARPGVMLAVDTVGAPSETWE